jgi:hypothetical protein
LDSATPILLTLIDLADKKKLLSVKCKIQACGNSSRCISSVGGAINPAIRSTCVHRMAVRWPPGFIEMAYGRSRILMKFPKFAPKKASRKKNRPTC